MSGTQTQVEGAGVYYVRFLLLASAPTTPQNTLQAGFDVSQLTNRSVCWADDVAANYRWDETSVAAPDNATVVLPSGQNVGTPGRWLVESSGGGGGTQGVIAFDTVQELRDYGTPSPLNGPVVAITRGVLFRTEQLERRWTWDPVATNTDNTGTVLLPTGQLPGTPGRWMGDLGEVILAQWWGLRGGDANAVADTEAFENFWQFMADESAAARLRVGVAQPFEISIAKNNLFGDITQSNLFGWVLRGSQGVNSNAQGSSFKILDPVTHKSFYQNPAGSRKLMGLKFYDIRFRGNDSLGTELTVLFNPNSVGHEQSFLFRGCHFVNCWTAMQVDGSVNNSEHIFEACFFTNMGRNGGAIMAMNNGQAVAHRFTDCNAIGLGGDVFKLMTGGGGGGTIWDGGSIAFNTVNDAKYLIRGDTPGANQYGPLSGSFTIKAKVELQENGRLFYWRPGTNNSLVVNFDVDIGSGISGVSPRTLVDVSQRAIVTIQGQLVPNIFTAQYSIDNTGASGGNFSGSVVRFRNATLPGLIHQNMLLVSKLGGGGYIIEPSCQLYPFFTTDWGTALGVTMSAIGLAMTNVQVGEDLATDFNSGSFNNIYNSASQQRKFVLNGRTYLTSPAAAIQGPLYLGLPFGARLTRIFYQMAVTGAGGSSYQLQARLGFTLPGIVIAASPIQAQHLGCVIDWKSEYGVVVGGTIHTATLVIETTAGNGGNLVRGVRNFFVEYETD